jgi:hypothetical protein
MSTIVTRAGKGSALTWTEGDANITNLNNDKMEKSAPVLAGNLDVATYSIITSTTNGNIVIEPNGTGDVHLVTDALRVGDLNTEARISTYGTGNLVLTTNEGNDPDPSITIGNGANADITIAPTGTGSIILDGQYWPQADGTADQVLKTNGSGQLSWTTVSSSNAATVTLTNDESTAATNYVLFANATTGNLSPRTDSGLTWNPSTNTLIAVGGRINKNGGYTGANFWGAGGGGAFTVATGTYTDTSSTGTLANGFISSFNAPTYAASSSLTFTDAANVYVASPIAGTNVTITNRYAAILGGNVKVGNGTDGELRILGTAGFYTGFKSGAPSANLIWTLPTADGTADQVLKTNGSGVLGWATPTTNVVNAAHFARSSGQTSGIGAGNPIIFDATVINVGSNISLNSSTGVITLLAGSTYKLMGNLGRIDASSNSGYVDYQWYNVTTSAYIGTAASLVVVSNGSNANNDGQATAIITPVANTQVRLNIVGTTAVTQIGQYAQYPTAIVEILGGPAGPTGPSGQELIQDLSPQLGADLDVNGFAISSAANANVNITPNGTGQTVLKNIEYQEYVYSLGTTSGTIAPNATNGNIQTITLNGNLTINAFTSPVSGQTITLIITTGGAGRTLTSSMLFAGASKTLSTTSTVDILTMSYIGTTYYASLAKGFA